MALALGAFDGVLAIEPRHPAVLARLDEVARSDRRRRLLRRGAAALGVLVAAALAVLGVARLRESAPASGPAPAVASPGPPDGAASPAAAARRRAPGRSRRARSRWAGPCGGTRPGGALPAGGRTQGIRTGALHRSRSPVRPARPARWRRGRERRATGGLLPRPGKPPAPHRAPLLRAVRARAGRRLGGADRRAQGSAGCTPRQPARRRGTRHPRLRGREAPRVRGRLAARALPGPGALRRPEPVRGRGAACGSRPPTGAPPARRCASVPASRSRSPPF